MKSLKSYRLCNSTQRQLTIYELLGERWTEGGTAGQTMPNLYCYYVFGRG